MKKHSHKKVTPFFTDARGEMSYIIDGDSNVNSVLLITCNKGAVRANHYHKKNDHYAFMLKGSMEYIWYDVKAKNKRKKKIIAKAGDLVYTPPMVAHAMRFLEPSSFLALSKEKRGKGKYEEDLIRVKII